MPVVMFEVRNISFSYRREPVLKDVSFFVSPGETVSILGENGAGKTTLLKVLSTLHVPDSGQILAEGKDVLRNAGEYRRQIGYLPEKVALYDDMTVREYLVYRAALKGEPPKRIRRRVGEAAESCRVSDWLGKTIGTLSTGQKKRVALADALLLRPRVLLLDDFLAGLDYNMRMSAGEILSDAAAFSAVVVTGHEVEALSRWTSRFLLLRNGTIAATVTTAGMDEASLRQRINDVLRGECP